MPMEDKIAAAKRIDGLLRMLMLGAHLRLRYRITVDPPLPEERDWEKPAILVEFSGPDAPMLLERNAELLRSFEHLAQEMLRLGYEEHDKVSFDALNHRVMRVEDLRMSARVAAERVRKSGTPYTYSPMTSRERRILHLALREEADLRTESTGAAAHRSVVVYPKDYKPETELRRGPTGGAFSTKRGRR